MRLTKNLVRIATGGVFLALAAAASAKYPTKPVTLVSPYGPGGAADLAARTLAGTAPAYLGNAVLVVNRTGAAGVTGSTTVAKGRKDGYTVLLARVGSQAAVPAINRKIPYVWDEFTFLGLLELNPFVLVVNAKSPLKSPGRSQVGAERRSEAQLFFGGRRYAAACRHEHGPRPVRNGTGRHEACAYKGGGKAAAAVVGGHVDMMFQNLSGVIGNIRAGKMRALAVSTPNRVAALPDVPTVAEAGYPALETVVGWSGVWGPPGMNGEAADKWVEVLGKIKSDQAWIKLTKGLGSIPHVLGPADTKAFVKKQYEAFRNLTEKLGMTIR